jgi:hypothetical protein
VYDEIQMIAIRNQHLDVNKPNIGSGGLHNSYREYSSASLVQVSENDLQKMQTARSHWTDYSNNKITVSLLAKGIDFYVTAAKTCVPRVLDSRGKKTNIWTRPVGFYGVAVIPRQASR